MRFFLFIPLFSVLVTDLFCQQIPVYNHFYNNPYLYNPAFAGADGGLTAALTHRQQWVGIEDAPVVTNFSIHKPFKLGLSFGLNFTNDQRGILSTSTGLITAGYGVGLGGANLRFGISGGIGTNSLDLDELGMFSDPVLTNAVDNNLFVDGNAGIALTTRNLNLGFSLPRIFETPFISEDDFSEVEIDPTDAFIAHGSYRYYFPGSPVGIEPAFIFRSQQDIPSQFEGAGIIHLMDLVWVGASYRQDFGLSGLLGVEIGDLLEVSYAYEPAGDQVSGFSDGSHEFQVKISFGKKKRPTAKKDEDLEEEKEKKSTAEIMAERRRKLRARRDSLEAIKKAREAEKEQTVVTTPDEDVETTPEVEEFIEDDETAASEEKTETEHPKVIRKEDGRIILDAGDEPVRVKRGDHRFDLDHGIYVVVGVFEFTENAIKYSDQLFGRYEIMTEYGFSSDTEYWYVYTMRTPNDYQAAVEERTQIRKTPKLSDVWILIVE